MSSVSSSRSITCGPFGLLAGSAVRIAADRFAGLAYCGIFDLDPTARVNAAMPGARLLVARRRLVRVLLFAGGQQVADLHLARISALVFGLGCFVGRTEWRKSRWVLAIVAIAWLVQAVANQVVIPLTLNLARR